MMEVVRVSALTRSPLYHPVNWTFDEVGQSLAPTDGSTEETPLTRAPA